MNPNTGHLIAELNDEKSRDGYLRLPQGLQRAARRELSGRTDTHINLRAQTPLATWAKKKRKAKIAAASRRRNRK